MPQESHEAIVIRQSPRTVADAVRTGPYSGTGVEQTHADAVPDRNGTAAESARQTPRDDLP